MVKNTPLKQTTLTLAMLIPALLLTAAWGSAQAEEKSTVRTAVAPKVTTSKAPVLTTTPARPPIKQTTKPSSKQPPRQSAKQPAKQIATPAKPSAAQPAHTRVTTPATNRAELNRRPLSRLTNNRFTLSISGLRIDQNQVRRVVIGDMVTRNVSTGVFHGKENIAPFAVELGKLQLTLNNARLLDDWLRSRQPRTVTIAINGPSGAALTYTLTGVAPQAKRGKNVLDARIDNITHSGTSLRPNRSGNQDWEWEGVNIYGWPMSFREGAMQVTRAADGSVSLQPTNRNDASLWQFTTTLPGAGTEALDVLTSYAEGDYTRRAQSRIFRNQTGVETDRTNYYETFVSRYSFPVLDKDRVADLSESITHVATVVERGSGGRIFSGPPNALRDPLVSSNFEFELEGINIASDDVLAVRMGAASTELVSTGSFRGKQSVAPVGVRWANLELDVRAQDTLMEAWLADTQAGNVQPRAASVTLLGREGQERMRYFLYELIPLSLSAPVKGVQTLVASVAFTESTGTGGVPDDSLPVSWEMDGVLTFEPVLHWSEIPVLITPDGAGGATRQTATSANANYIEIGARTPGTYFRFHELLNAYRNGQVQYRAQSRIERDNNYQETSRRNFYETFISRLEYPVLDRRRHDLVTERIVHLTPRVDQEDQGMLFLGGINAIMDPVLTRNFRLEINGINLNQADILGVDIGPSTTDAVYFGTFGGKQAYLPAAVRHSDITITSRNSAALANWYNQSMAGSANRDLEVIVLGINGEERMRLQALATRPVAFAGGNAGSPDTLVVRPQRLIHSGGMVGTPDNVPNDMRTWEWEGVNIVNPVLEWTDTPLLYRQSGAQPVSASEANLWRFGVKTIGLQDQFMHLLDDYRQGRYDRRAHTHIFRDANGEETYRTNFYETWLESIKYATFRRDEVVLASQTSTHLATMVENYPGERLMTGIPRMIPEPLLSNRFELEIEGVNVDANSVRSVTFGDATVDLVHTGRYFGIDGVRPAGVSYGNIVIVAQPSAALDEWINVPPTQRSPRAMSVIANNRGDAESGRFNAYQVMVVDAQTLPSGERQVTLKTDLVEWLGGSQGTTWESYHANRWEWSGINIEDPALGIGNRPLKVSWQPSGISVAQSTSGQTTNYWELSATVPGLPGGVFAELDAYRNGQIVPREMSQIDFDAAGQEIKRTDLFNTYLSRVTYPRFDKTTQNILATTVTAMSRAASRSGEFLVDGPFDETPLVSDRFHVEIDNVVIDPEHLVRFDWGAINFAGTSRSARMKPVSMTVTTRGITSLSQWHAAYNSGNQSRRTISVIYQDLAGNERYRYNLFEAVPLKIQTSGSGPNRVENLSIRVNTVRLAGNHTNGGELTTLDAGDAAGRRTFLLAIAGSSDTSSWETLNRQSKGGVTSLELRGLLRDLPRGYIGTWLSRIAGGSMPSVDMTLSNLSASGKVTSTERLTNCAPRRLQLPMMDKTTRQGVFVNLSMQCGVAAKTPIAPARKSAPQKTKPQQQPLRR